MGPLAGAAVAGAAVAGAAVAGAAVAGAAVAGACVAVGAGVPHALSTRLSARRAVNKTNNERFFILFLLLEF